MDGFLSEGVRDVIRCLELVLVLFLVAHVMMKPRHKHNHKVYHVSNEGLASGPVDYSWGGNVRFMSESTGASTASGQEGAIGAPLPRSRPSRPLNIPHGPAKLELGQRSGFVGGYEAPAFWGPTGGQALSNYNQQSVYAGDDDGALARQQVLANQAVAALAKAKSAGEGMMSDSDLALALNGR